MAHQAQLEAHYRVYIKGEELGFEPHNTQLPHSIVRASPLSTRLPSLMAGTAPTHAAAQIHIGGVGPGGAPRSLALEEATRRPGRSSCTQPLLSSISRIAVLPDSLPRAPSVSYVCFDLPENPVCFRLHRLRSDYWIRRLTA